MSKQCLFPGKCNNHRSKGSFFSPGIQKKEMLQHEGEEEDVQRKGGDKTGKIPDHFQTALDSNRGKGEPLPVETRQFMEEKMGADFTSVRVHNDNEASQLSTQIQAKAFTSGNDIYFNKGKYAPHTSEGKSLMAHELTHVIHQNGSSSQVQRAPDPAQEELKKKADALEKEIYKDSAYKKLATDSKQLVWRIVYLAKKKPLGENKGERNYYLLKLKLAINTPFNGTETGKAEYGCSPEAEKENRDEVQKALDIEKKWWEGSGFENVEEAHVATGTEKKAKIGEQRKKFWVDRTDPRDIRVMIKVKLNGKPEEVAQIIKLEDAIERSAKTKGYVLDIVFVDKTGADVFEFTVAFCEWANSGNWASGPVTLSHEVHHALGLGDRYDYIESHSKNEMMNVPMRLVWFNEQMGKKTSDRDPYSKMSTNENPLLAEDVCAIAFESAADQKKCVEARKDLDPSHVPPVK
jgi:hypothetical protein